ncbi:hypothetical protein [Mesorhizobium sp. B1-1-6]|uniref:hypothetical protein n=1 Tax=Mesorhizobium sp. B1-1-6 TaxID=2589978 RepID=UPI00112A5F91|nr:hypothetical protein [Mesorhizobium sp. B1-1-6]TPN41389.1 hypothetical protein FJ979_04535 [Mesorhizobium sp. B1-1-6]
MGKKPPLKGKSTTFAALVARRDQARAKGDILRFEAIEVKIAAIKQAEENAYRHHFLKSREQKARLLLTGWLEEGAEGLPQHRFPERGSFLEYECRWALAEVLRSKNPPRDIIQGVAALFVPNSGHPLAHTYFIAEISRRGAGRPENTYTRAQIAGIVETAVLDGRGVEAGVEEALQLYGKSREYVYRCWKEYRPEPLVRRSGRQ